MLGSGTWLHRHAPGPWNNHYPAYLQAGFLVKHYITFQGVPSSSDTLQVHPVSFRISLLATAKLWMLFTIVRFDNPQSLRCVMFTGYTLSLVYITDMKTVEVPR